MLEFDPGRHEYKWCGQRKISNTDVLSITGLSDYSMVPKDRLQITADLGTQVHKVTLLHDQKKEWRDLWDFLEGYVEAWVGFKHDYGFTPKLREQPIYDELVDCCTCIDAYGYMRKIRDEATVQIKTGAVQDEVALQTAFEERAANLYLGRKEAILRSSNRRFGVELQADGKYKVRRFDHPGYENDIRVFLAALTVARWKVRHK